MEGFTYTNIFDTKGIEYLAIISFFLLLVPFWMLLTRPVKIPAGIRKTIGFLTTGSFRVPQGLFYSKYHSWTHLEKSGLAKVGMDDFLTRLIGEVKLINLRNQGEQVKKGELLAVVNQDGKTLNIFSPVTGEIMAVNDLLVKNPDLLTEDPYEKGWFYKIKPTNWVQETSTCFFADNALTWMEQEFYRFKDFMSSVISTSNGNSKLILQDGGELVSEPLRTLSGDIWNTFQYEFLEQKALVSEYETFSES
jgi:glycine cleavage system H protein